MTSTSLPRSASVAPARSHVPALLREPLLHFVLLGGLLFGIDHVLVGRIDDPHVIVMGESVDREAKQLFKDARGREPNADELKALRQTWLDNEVLYREGLAMQVDRGDPAIRERVIFKALSVVDASVKAPPITDAELRRWFEAHRDKYDEPARHDFQEAVLAGNDNTEAAVKAFADNLNKGAPGELNAGLRVFKGRPRANLADSYGEAFAKALEEAPVGEWRAYATRDGWRAMRLDASTPPKPADFDTVRGVVMHDWIDVTMAEQRTGAVRALGKKYTVRQEAAQ
jgi:hypothetical protein